MGGSENETIAFKLLLCFVMVSCECIIISSLLLKYII